MPRLFAALHRLIWLHPRATIAVLAALSAAAALAASRLHFSSDIAKILPRRSPAMNSVNQLMEHFAFTGQMFLFFEKKSPSASDDAAMRLADGIGRRLREAPEAKAVEWKMTAESEKFLEELVSGSGPLLLSEEEMEGFLKRLEKAEIRKVVKKNRRRLAGPGAGLADVLVARDPLDLTRDFFLKRLNAAKPAGDLDLSTGYYFNGRRDALVMTVEGREGPHDVEFAKKLVERTQAAIAAARAEAPGSEGWDISILGGYPIAVQNEATIRGDMAINLLTSVPPVLLMLLISLRRWFGLAIGAAALTAGILWTFGLAGLAFGHLTAVTVAFAGLLAGIGIDLTIHMFHRYRHEREIGNPPSVASEITYAGSGPGAFTAMITTVFSILCLWISEFQGLREFATLVGVGLILVFIATFLVIPLFTRTESHEHRNIPTWAVRVCWALFAVYLAASVSLFTAIGVVIAASCAVLMTETGKRWMIALICGRPRLAAGTASAITAVALVAMFSKAPLGLPERETDVKNLRNEEDRILDAQERMRHAFESGIEPILVLDVASGEDEAMEKAAAVAAKLRGFPGAASQSITDFLPPAAEQEQRAARLGGVDAARVEADLDAALDAEGFDPEAFGEARAWLRGLLAARKPVRPSDIRDPFFVAARNRFVSWDKSGAVRTLTWVTPVSPLHIRQEREEVLNRLESTVKQASPTAVLAGFSVVVKEIDDRIGPDIFWSSLAGVAVSCLLAWVLYRSFQWMVVSIFPAIVGTTWVLGLFKMMDMKMNYLNLIVFPIMAGIATDNGLYMVERFRELDCRSARKTMESLWAGLTLVSLATVVGFGSMAFSSNRAIKSLGVALAAAMLCYTFSSLFVLPPILTWLETGDEFPDEPQESDAENPGP